MKTPTEKPKPRKVPNENSITNAILTYLNCQPNTFAWRNNTTGIYDSRKKCYRARTGKYNIKGVADILGITDDGEGRGIFIAIEVKRPGGRASREQQNYLSRIKALGGIAGIATSVLEAKEILTGETHETKRLPRSLSS